MLTPPSVPTDNMLHYKFHWLLLLAYLPLAAQEKVDTVLVRKLKDEGLYRSQVMQTAFYLSDVIGPRVSGSAGLAKANEWTRAKLESWGLKNAVVEPWGAFGRGWEIEKSYVALKAPYYQALIGTPRAWTPGTGGLVRGEVVLATPANLEDFARYRGKLRGKVVLMPAPWEVKTSFLPDGSRFTEAQLARMENTEEKAAEEPDPDENQRQAARVLRYRFTKFSLAEGAIAILSNGRGKHGTHFTSNAADFEPGAEPVLPEVQLVAEHYGRIRRLLENNHPVEVEMEIQTRFPDAPAGYNVVAEIPGTDKKRKAELVMLGAHLDSWHAATGASDNAAGVAVMMEAVRLLQVLGVKPRRTIRIALWGAEEQGILGSSHYVKNHFRNPDNREVRPGYDKLSVYYNLDNGTGRIRGVYLQENAAVRPIFKAWLAPFADMGAGTLALENTDGTDHIAFDEAGLPGFQFIQDEIEYETRSHHSNMDTYERLEEADLKQAAIVVAAFVYHSAMRDEKLPRKATPATGSKAMR